jgi:hypothetical protein
MSIADMTTKCSIEVEIFEYDQLPKDYQIRLLAEESQSLAEIWQCDHLVDEFKERLEAIGFMEPEVWYSGFGSQGDGACFDAKVDLKKVFKHLGIEYDPEKEDCDCAIDIINRHYNHEQTRRINYSSCFLSDDEDAEVLNKLETLRLELCKDFYRLLEDDYSGEIGDERCLEELRSRSFVMRKALEGALAEAVDGSNKGELRSLVEIV